MPTKPDDTITISFPDLSPAEASILARELEQRLVSEGISADAIRVTRENADAQDMGTILTIIGSAWFLDMMSESSKGFVKGLATGAGRATFDWLLRKYGTSAKIEHCDGPPIIIGEEHKRQGPSLSGTKAQRLADLETLGVVLLGAKTFPFMPAHKNLDNQAFKNSADAAKEMFSPEYTLFRETKILDLFDSDLRADEIVEKVIDFITVNPDMRDIIFYYVGHGGFIDLDKRFYVLLKNTRPNREPATSLVLRDFRSMITSEHVLHNKRCYFFVDSCFATAAVDAFQFQGPEAVVASQMQNEILPAHGWAFFTASGRDTPAIGADGTGHTMFTGALKEIISGKNWQRPPSLTLDDLAEQARHYIRSKHGDKGELPQCHAPQQADGDISRLPLFVLPTPAGRQWHIPAEPPKTAAPEETAAYEALMKAPNIAGCEQFLHAYSDSPYAMAVRPLLENLRSKEQQKHECHQREEEAKRLREARQHFEEEAVGIWAQLEPLGDIKAIEDFIRRYPDTPSAAQAQTKLDLIFKMPKGVDDTEKKEKKKQIPLSQNGEGEFAKFLDKFNELKHQYAAVEKLKSFASKIVYMMLDETMTAKDIVDKSRPLQDGLEAYLTSTFNINPKRAREIRYQISSIAQQDGGFQNHQSKVNISNGVVYIKPEYSDIYRGVANIKKNAVIEYCKRLDISAPLELTNQQFIDEFDKLSAFEPKRGVKQKRKERQARAGLQELARGLNKNGYRPPAEYTGVVESLRLLWGGDPKPRKLYTEMTYADLANIMDRGARKVK